MSGSMKKLICALVVLISIFALAGCDSARTSGDVALEDTDWVMESYGEAGNLKDALPGVEVTLYFNSASGEFGGFTGINYCGGEYQLNGSQISFPQGVAITEMAGDPVVQQQEGEYIILFSTADSFEIVDGKLHLICDSQEIIFYASATPPAITATGWP